MNHNVDITPADVTLNEGRNPSKDDFYLTVGEPQLHKFGWYPLFHINYWNSMQKKDGTPAFFCAVHLFWFLRFYFCTAKIDGTRTYQYWNGQLGGRPEERSTFCFVANAGVPQPLPYLPFIALCAEHWAIRIQKQAPDCEVWSNMGGL